MSSVDITNFLTSDSQCTRSPVITAASPNTKTHGSPPKETVKRAVHDIGTLFQRAAEKKRARTGSSVPGVTHARMVSSALESPICEDKGFVPAGCQTPKGPMEQSINSNGSSSVQSQLFSGPSLPSFNSGSEAMIPLVRKTSIASLERELLEASSELPDLYKEESEQFTPGRPQQASHSFTGDRMLCEKCNQSVLVWQFTEHLDYHFAVELQNSFSESSCFRPPVAISSPSAKGKSKPRTHTASVAKRPKQETVKTLDSFFKRLPT